MAKKVAQLLDEQMLASRSELYRWLHAHRDEIGPRLKARKAWQALANTAAGVGVRTAKGTPPSRQMVRKTWLLLEQDLAADAGIVSESPKHSPAKSPAVAEPPRQAAPTPTTEHEDQPRPRFQPKPVVLRGYQPPPPKEQK